MTTAVDNNYIICNARKEHKLTVTGIFQFFGAAKAAAGVKTGQMPRKGKGGEDDNLIMATWQQLVTCNLHLNLNT